MDNRKLTIKELLERYDLRTRQSIYDWCKKGAKIELKKDESGRSYATPEQVALLDQLAEHLKKPDSTLSNFVPVSIVEVDTPIDTTIDNSIDNNSTEIEPQIDTSVDRQLIAEISSQIGMAIASQVNNKLQQIDPLWYHSALERASTSGWLLTTKEVKSLIGVTPRTKKSSTTFKRGNWVFIKSGKIGSQTAWRVNKVNQNDDYKV